MRERDRATHRVMNKFACSCRVSRKKPETSLARGHRSRAFRFHFFTRWQSNVRNRCRCFSSRSAEPWLQKDDARVHHSTLSLSLDFLESSLHTACCLLPFILPSILPRGHRTPPVSYPTFPFAPHGKRGAAARERKREKDD